MSRLRHILLTPWLLQPVPRNAPIQLVRRQFSKLVASHIPVGPIGLLQVGPSLHRLYSDSKQNDPSKDGIPCQEKENSQNNDSGADEYDKVQLTTQEQEKLHKFTKVIEDNSYYAKYKAKIVNFQRSSPHAFLALVDQLISSSKKYAEAPARKAKTMQNRKKLVLDEIMKLSSLLSLDRQDICFIWTEFHNSAQMIAAVMSGSKHESIVKKAEAYSSFVLPLPRKGLHEFFLAQYGDDSFYFTPLAVYHKYKENSPVCLTLSHYDELKETKDLILLRGEYDKDVIDLKEAQYLAVQLNCYYGENNQRRLEIMKDFHENASSFEYMNLISELNSLESEYVDVFPKLK